MSVFEFVDLPPRASKPRVVGLTMVIEKGLSVGAARELASTAGDWIDVIKLGWGTTRVTPPAVVRDKILTYRAVDIDVSNGGTLFELAHLKGKVPELLAEMKELGFTVCEISEGTVEIDEADLLRYVAMAREAGLKPVVEVGKKMPSEDLEAAEYARQLNTFLEAGAHYVIVEAREGGVGVGVFDEQGLPKLDILDKATEGLPIERVLFEAPLKSQQVFFIKRYGRDVNLGNIPPEEAIALETLRRGVRGDTLNLFHGSD